MLRAVLALGLSLTFGAAAVGYDFNRQMTSHPEPQLELGAYLGMLPNRVVNLLEPPTDPRAAKLPQVRRMAAAGSDHRCSLMSGGEQIDDLVKNSPQLRAMLKADRAASRKGFWARLRQKVAGPETKQKGGRLTAIRERNFPTPKAGISPEGLSGMSATELYRNRAAIQGGLANTAASNLKAASSLSGL